MAVDVPGLAARLADAERERRTIPQLSTSEPALDLDAAYAVQQHRFEARLASGDTPIGFKLGLTSRAKQEAMGVAIPLWGRLSNSMLHSEFDPLLVSSLIHPRIEPEIAFLLERDVDGRTATPASVLAATKGLFAALEILDSRYDDFRFTLADVVADNASAARVVCGGALVPPASMNCQLEGMVLHCNGEVVATASGAAVSGHPAAAVAWLARIVGSLPAGAIVLSGGLTAPVSLQQGTVVSAEFASLGSVTLRCT
jgi:2-oxo-3-hexenedioate decarboxylase